MDYQPELAAPAGLSRDEDAEGLDAATGIKAEEIRTLLRELLASGRTQRALAQETGVSQGLLSKWLGGKCEGSKAIVGRLIAWQQHREKMLPERVPGVPDWVATQTGEEIKSALTFAQTEPSISVVFGGAGVGKTTAIRRYGDENPHVWVVTSSPARGSMAAALGDVADTLGLRGLSHRADQVSRDIMQRVQGTRGLLVVDEAQHLTVAALEELRAIHDRCAIGLCLSGNDAVYSKMTGGNRRAVFAQLFSRIGWRLALRAPAEADVDAILCAWGIDGPRELEFARRIAGLPGGLRGLFQVLRQASFAARASGEPVDMRLMRAAWRDLGGEL